MHKTVPHTGTCCGQGSLGAGTATGTQAPGDPLSVLPTPALTATSATPAGDSFTPGTYNVNTFGNSAFTGDGVTIYFECGSSGGSSHAVACTTSSPSGAGLDVSGDATLALTPPTSGIWTGVSVFFDRKNGSKFLYKGNAAGSLSGTIYALSSDLTFTGSSALSGVQFLVNTLAIGASTTFSATVSGVTTACRVG